MAKKQVLPNELDVETLINQVNDLSSLEEGPVSNNTNYDNILDFISFYNIKPGTHKVKNSMLYKLYKAWTNEINFNKHEFPIKMNSLFENVGGNILINIDTINLTSKAKEVFFKPVLRQGKKTKEIKRHIEMFLTSHKITNGKYSIDGNILFYMYKQWVKDKRKKTLKYTDFMVYMTYYLKFYRLNEAHSYNFYIDKQQLEVDGVTLENAKDYSQKKKEDN